MKFLNVAEKNSAAKTIAALLSRGTATRREGLSLYNKIYEFKIDVKGQRWQMVMTSVSGHLLELKFDDAHESWQCAPLSLFDAPVIKYCPNPSGGNDGMPVNHQKIKKTLEREVRSCDGLIIWTDCDREGENIGFQIIEVSTAVNKNLDIYRARFCEITSGSVQRALDNLDRPTKRISDAVDVRRELDLRIGAAFTRFQTGRLRKVFPSKLGNKKIISFGSCQFPTLGFVVERYRAVENFVPRPFWKITVNHTQNDLSIDFVWEKGRKFDRDDCQQVHDVCLEYPEAKVCDVKTEATSKQRPLPLNTVELEKLASRKLNFTAMDTMKIAEKLYMEGLTSYPRTETNVFSEEINLGELVNLQIEDPNWGFFAQKIMNSGGPTPRQGDKSDKAHPPIYPTKRMSDLGLTGNQKLVYELIVRSFLACCSQDAQGQETVVSVEVAGEKFSASGLAITARNYLDVYPYEEWLSNEIHVYETGQTFNPTSIEMVAGSTSPPDLLTEADLIEIMETHGIGTDATHAGHINTIKERNYVTLDGIHFVPDELGIGLVEGYDAMGLAMAKPDLRAQLEADLIAISEGEKEPRRVLVEQIAKYKKIYLKVLGEANKLDTALAKRFKELTTDDTPAGSSTQENNTAGGESSRDVLCDCKKLAIQLTTKKPGPNFGKQFYKCAVGKDFGGCEFYLWAPESGSPVKCNCNLPCKQSVVRKGGKNRGRQFYGCPKIPKRCEFFEWADGDHY